MSTTMRDEAVQMHEQSETKAIDAAIIDNSEQVLDLVQEMAAMESIALSMIATPDRMVGIGLEMDLADLGLYGVGNESFGEVVDQAKKRLKELYIRLVELIKRGARYLLDKLSDSNHVLTATVDRLNRTLKKISDGKLKLKSVIRFSDLSSLVVSAGVENKVDKKFFADARRIETVFIGSFDLLAKDIESDVQDMIRAKETAANLSERFLNAVRQNHASMFGQYSIKALGVPTRANTNYSEVFLGGFTISCTQEEDNMSFNVVRGVDDTDFDIEVPKFDQFVAMTDYIEEKMVPRIVNFRKTVDATSKSLIAFLSRMERHDTQSRVNTGDLRGLGTLFATTMLSTSSVMSTVYRSMALSVLEILTKSVEKVE